MMSWWMFYVLLLLASVANGGYKTTTQEFYYKEGQPQGGLVGRINLQFNSINKQYGGKEFIINPTTHDIIAREVIDFETLNSSIKENGYRFNVTLDRDKLLKIIIYIQDINDNFPKFSSHIKYLSIPENVNIYKKYNIPTAEDLDSNSVILYRINSGNRDEYFRLSDIGDDHKLFLEVLKTLDYENIKEYTLNISACDPVLDLCDYIEINITVLDENDNKPQFLEDTYYVQLYENVTVGSIVFKVQAVDKDSTRNGEIMYSLTDNPKFSVDVNTGELKLDHALDVEKRASYMLIAIATDKGIPPETSTCQIRVRIVDCNDNAPNIDVLYDEGDTIEEKTDIGTRIANISVWDSDKSDENNQVTLIAKSEYVDIKVIQHSLYGLYVMKEIDRNTIGEFNLTLTAIDNGKPVLKTSKYVVFKVKDINNHVPKFPESLYTESLHESTEAGHNFMQLTAKDQDFEENSRLTYAIETASEYFWINKTTGQLILIHEIDREVIDHLKLTVSVHDNGDPQLSSKCEIEISILDDNDNDPEFLSEFMKFRFTENNIIGLKIGRVKATDVDIVGSDRISYYFKEAYDGFKIDKETGEITLTRSFDREKQASYRLTVVAEDGGGRKGYGDIEILLNDVNDYLPRFEKKFYNITIHDNFPVNQAATYVKAIDLDEDGSSNMIYSETDMGKTFSIDSNSGAIYIQRKLKRRKQNVYKFLVHVRGKEDTLSKDTAHVQINILPPATKPPVFTQLVYHFKMSENNENDYIVGRVKARREKSLSDSFMDYTIIKGRRYQVLKEKLFSIDRKGVIRASKKIDFERWNLFILKISATDLLDKSLTKFTDVFIRIVDQNDNAPTFVKKHQYVTVKEGVAIGRKIYDCSALDIEDGLNGKIVYSIVNPSPHLPFKVINATGEIITTGTLDYEVTQYYEVIVNASDCGIPSLSTQMTLHITIRDENDNVPKFTKSVYFLHVKENSTAGTLLLHVEASDIDSNENGNFSFKMDSSVDADSFLLLNGELILRKTLDREKKQHYIITLRVQDKGSPALESSAVVNIVVEDVNDNAPEFQFSKYEFILQEESPPGIIGNISAMDADEGTNSEYTYTLLNERNKFSLEIQEHRANSRYHALCYVVSLRSFDSERDQQNYTLLINVTDKLNPTFTNQALVHVIIQNINDVPPKFTRNLPYITCVYQGQEKDEFVIQVVATDEDIVKLPLKYELIALNPKEEKALEYFRVESNNGKIFTKIAINTKEIVFNASIAVTEESRDINLCNVQKMIIFVVPKRKQLLFDKHCIQVPVIENKKIEQVFRIFEDSSDFPSNRQNYSLQNIPHVPFEITSTGLLRSTKQLKRHVRPFYQLTVFASGLILGTDEMADDSITVNVYIIAKNTFAPFYPNNPEILSVYENEAPLTKIGSLKGAIDHDPEREGWVTYSIIETSLGDIPIQILPPWGREVYIQRPLDREDDEYLEQINLKIRMVDLAEDITQRKSNTFTLNLIIQDRNDNKPVFESGNFTDVLEDQGIGSIITQVFAEDPDVGDTHTNIIYTIISGNEENKFSIQSESGIVKLNQTLDINERHQYNLSILAKEVRDDDSKIEALNSTMILTIKVIDVNNHKPVFENATYKISFKEGQPKGTFMLQVHATDMDNEEDYKKVSYRLLDENSMFNIDANTGKITSNYIFDREKIASYHLKVSAENELNPYGTDVCNVVVNIEDINDHPPIFLNGDKIIIKVLENSPPSPVHTFVATDKDFSENSRSKFYINQNGGSKKFKLDPEKGVLSVLKKLDREQRNRYEFSVTAENIRTPYFRAMQNVTVLVLDENDEDPVFQQRSYKAVLYEADVKRKDVLQVKAIDRDEGTNAYIMYSIIEGKNSNVSKHFEINAETGEIFLSAPVDFEQQRSFEFKVQASGVGENSTDYANVIVNVTDANDNPPVFTLPVYEVVLGKVSLLLPVTKVTATDADHNGAENLKYMIEPHSQDFSINEKTGQITLMKTNLIYGQYHLNVIANDQGEPPLNGSCKVFVTVGDPDVTKLKFLNSSVMLSIDENPSPKLKLGKLVALSDVEKDIKYSILEPSNPHRAFKINRVTGELMVANPTIIDYEKYHEFHLSVLATVTTYSDGTDFSCYLAVVVIIRNLNDNTPTILPDRGRFHYTETEITDKTYFLLYEVFDKDEVDNSKLKIEIISGNEDGTFRILPDTFLLYLEKSIDYEKHKLFNLVVRVNDSGNPPLHSYSHLQVIVRDKNDNPPKFINKRPLNVSEAAAMGTAIGKVQVFDIDEKSFQRYKLISVSSTKDQNLFQIDVNSGVITLHGQLDYEEVVSYTLNISVYDGNFIVYDSFTVNVDDENDNQPYFERTNYVASIKAKLVKNEFVTKVKALDKDSGRNGKVQYKISPPSDEFSIEQDTGIIIASKDKEFEPEVDIVVLTIVASDLGERRLKTTVSVQLGINGLKNTLHPDFEKRSYHDAITEGAQIGAVVDRVYAFFSRTYQRKMTYRITQGNINNAFAINKTSGHVTVNNELDREILDTYALEILADVHDSNISAKCIMMIHILDANDNSPVFNQRTYNISVNEGLEPKSHLLTVKAIDADDPNTKNGQVKYGIHSGQADNEWVEINPLTGDVSTKKTLDREVRSRIQLTLEASDMDGYGQKDLASLNITVLDINDNTPHFNVDSPNIDNLQVAENRPVGELVLKSEADDADEGSNGKIIYDIINDASKPSVFRIDNETGWVFTLRSLDYEEQALYNLTVVAQDCGRPSRSASFEYHIAVLDVNEYKPQFTKKKYYFEIYANETVRSIIGQVQATDKDGGAAGKVRYSFENKISYFNIDASSGVIMVNNDIRRRESVRYRREVKDHKKKDTVDFPYTIRADNYDNSTLFDHATVTIKVNYSCLGCSIKTVVVPKITTSFNSPTIVIVITSVTVFFVILVLVCCFVYCRRKHTCLQRQANSPGFLSTRKDIFRPIVSAEQELLTNGVTPIDRIQNPIYSGFNTKRPPEDSSETDLIQASSGGTVRSVSVTDKASTFSFGIYHEQSIPDSQIQPFIDRIPELSLKDFERNSVFKLSNKMHKKAPPSSISHSTQDTSLYSVTSSRPPAKATAAGKRNRPVSHESLKDFQEEGGGEAAGGLHVENLLYAKLANVNDDEEEAVMDGVRPFREEGELSRLGSLSTIICDDEDDHEKCSCGYSENWNQEKSPLISRRKHPSSGITRSHQPQQKQTLLHMHNSSHINPRINEQNSSIPLKLLNSGNKSSISSVTSLPKTSHDVSSTYTSGALSPNFTPLMTPLIMKSPSVSSLEIQDNVSSIFGAKNYEPGYTQMLQRGESVASQLSKITLSDIDISDAEDQL